MLSPATAKSFPGRSLTFSTSKFASIYLKFVALFRFCAVRCGSVRLGSVYAKQNRTGNERKKHTGNAMQTRSVKIVRELSGGQLWDLGLSGRGFKPKTKFTVIT